MTEEVRPSYPKVKCPHCNREHEKHEMWGVFCDGMCYGLYHGDIYHPSPTTAREEE